MCGLAVTHFDTTKIFPHFMIVLQRYQYVPNPSLWCLLWQLQYSFRTMQLAIGDYLEILTTDIPTDVFDNF